MENGNATPPVISSVEDMLSAMGETVTKKKQDDDKVAINFVEYKAPPKQKPAPKATPKPAEPPKPAAPMTKAEAKRQKKLDKINVLPVAPVFTEAIARIYEETSVSTLFD